MRRRLFVLALALILLLSGCGSSITAPPDLPEATPTPTVTPKKTPFSLPYYSDASLHPIFGTNRTNQVLSSLVYQGLFELDNNFAAHPVLCSSFIVSEDALIWTFALRSATFSDGSALTGKDVVRSLELARESTLYKARLASVESIFAEGNIVTILLSSPNSAFPSLLDIPIIRESEDGSMPLGTGPYAFAEDEKPLRLSRQASAPSTAPAEIPLVGIDAADDLIYAFDAGNISLVLSDLTGANALGYSSGYECFDYPTSTLLYIGFQTTDGPCSDPNVRKALSRMLDRDTVVNSLLAGHAAATCLPFSPQASLYSAAHESAGSYDLSAAKELLQQSHYAVGEDGQWHLWQTSLSLTFAVNTDNTFKVSIANYLAEQLTDMGIHVTVQKMPWADYVSALEQGAFDLYLGEVTLTADFDLTPLLGSDGSLNYGGYESEEASLLLEQLRCAQGEALPLATADFLDQFQEDQPFAPLCFKSHSILTQWQSVLGMNPTRQNPFYHLDSLRFGAAT